MKKVVVLGFDGALASAITGVVDLFAMAGVSWNRIQQQEIHRLFQVEIASAQGQAIRCINGILIQAHLAYADIKDVDIAIVPTIAGPIIETLQQNPELIRYLKEILPNCYHQTAIIHSYWQSIPSYYCKMQFARFAILYRKPLFYN